MAKRCCAKHCFNSVLYNKHISYFSFPKNKFFADQWAELAGRSDLKDKPLNRIIKYYLCSEHFTANCFVDTERQTLKRNLPKSIAIPTIFKNNLQETLQIANPRQSMEVHNIIVLEDRVIKYSSPLEVTTDIASDNSSQTICTDEKTTDPFYKKDEIELGYLEMCVQSPVNEELDRTVCTTPPVILNHCRFCFKELPNKEESVNIENSMQLKEFVGRVMSNTVTVGDKLSQLACKNCENNALLCLIIIKQMDATQEKFALPAAKDQGTDLSAFLPTSS